MSLYYYHSVISDFENEKLGNLFLIEAFYFLETV